VIAAQWLENPVGEPESDEKRGILKGIKEKSPSNIDF
jgi:hypothetical protein